MDELLKKEGVSWTLRRAMRCFNTNLLHWHALVLKFESGFRLFTPKLVIVQTGNHLDIKFDTVAQSYDDSFEVFASESLKAAWPTRVFVQRLAKTSSNTIQTKEG